MEYTDYYVAKGPGSELEAKLEPIATSAMILDGNPDFLPFVRLGDDKALVKALPGCSPSSTPKVALGGSLSR